MKAFNEENIGSMARVGTEKAGKAFYSTISTWEHLCKVIKIFNL